MVRVLIKGFTELYPEEVLWMLFKPFGNVNYIKTKGFCVIADYSTKEEAESAICNLQYRKLHNSSFLELDLFYNPEKRVAVKNIHPAERIEEAMMRFGRIYNMKESPGYIYIDYYDSSSAQKAIKFSIIIKSNDEIIFNENSELLKDGWRRGNFLNTKKAPKNEKKKINETFNFSDDIKRIIKITRVHDCRVNDCQTVFLYNLSKKLSEGDLYNLFGKYGEIISCGIKNEKGFLNFSSKEAALRALKYMNGKIIKNSKIRVKIKNENHF
ncbi:hypothetical protein PAEPH01_1680 [Pancytospora epiphaga]|nr:hypothetical protein PAEPH01_1680 [Pancytospora epiphaga]